MTPTELLTFAAGVFEDLGVPYAVVGSMASSYFGEARLTNDVDILAELGPEHVTRFVGRFPTDVYYVSEDAVRAAIAHRSQFNIIQPDAGLKVDVMLPQRTAYDQGRLSRRVLGRPHGAASDAYFASPEDVIVKKLEFHAEGGSDKHLRDIAGMLKVSGALIDRAFVDRLARELGLSDGWQLAQERAKPKGA